jgi:8-amino-7-oxononanoate synthase
MALSSAALRTGWSGFCATSVVAGAAESAVALSARLAEAGFFVPAIRPPSVPHGRSLVRASLSWLHPQSDLDQLADAIVACLR